jgi:hypothetical protein
MKKIILPTILVAAYSCCNAQINIISTDSIAEQVLQGNYNPSTYLASTILNHPDTISQGINNRVSADSLKNYILALASFTNRNTGSDTVSTTRGIGAARRWVFQKFQQFSAANQNRLLPSYLQFNLSICGITQHRDVFAVLPGMDTTDKNIIIVEGHMDSRCEVLCDTTCIAEGVEDNSSGTALVLELARVMSKYSYNHTIVFLVTIGEEQGLYGANAFSLYVQQKTIPVEVVQNNDIVGGIICGQTSSPPSCPGLNNVDSTNVRLFSFGSFNSLHKGLARFVKLEYKEMIQSIATVPMTINIMSPEDRTGRGGDHQPFRLKNYTAIRCTSANEHGNANIIPAYTDRQHSTRDTLGTDNNGDGTVDSFFVDFNYLARNVVINGNAIGMEAIGPKTPDFNLTTTGQNLIVQVTQQTQYLQYRIGVRTLTNDWDSVYTFTGTLVDTINNLPPANYIVSIASVDTNGVESLFSHEKNATLVGINNPQSQKEKLTLLQNKPNPFDEATYISVLVNEMPQYKNAFIVITDIENKLVKKISVTLTKGMNDILYEHGYGMSGTYNYSLVIDGKTIMTRKMVFAN